MKYSDYITTARDLIGKALNVDVELIDPDSRVYTFPEWDSLGQLAVAHAVSEETGREVEDARTFARLISVKSIASILCANQAEQIRIDNPKLKSTIPASYYRSPNPIASLLLVHGISANRHEWGFFDLIALEALRKDISVISIDYQGHGKSNVPLSDISLYAIVDEINFAYEWMQSKHKNNSSIILGNSFGAGVSLLVGNRCNADLIAMSCPVTSYLADLSRITPNYGSFLEAQNVPYGNAQLPTSIIKEMEEIDESIMNTEVSCPVLFFHGAADSDVPCSEARNFAKGLPTSKFFEFENMDHTYTAPVTQKQRDEVTVRNRETVAKVVVDEIYERAKKLDSI